MKFFRNGLAGLLIAAAIGTGVSRYASGEEDDAVRVLTNVNGRWIQSPVKSTPYSTAFTEWVDENGDGNCQPKELKGRGKTFYLPDIETLRFGTEFKGHKGEEGTFTLHGSKGGEPLFKNEFVIERDSEFKYVSIPSQTLQFRGIDGELMIQWRVGKEENLSDAYKVVTMLKDRIYTVREEKPKKNNSGFTPYSFAFRKWDDKNGDGKYSEEEFVGKESEFNLKKEDKINFGTLFVNHEGEVGYFFLKNHNGEVLSKNEIAINQPEMVVVVTMKAKDMRKTNIRGECSIEWQVGKNKERTDAYKVRFYSED